MERSGTGSAGETADAAEEDVIDIVLLYMRSDLHTHKGCSLCKSDHEQLSPPTSLNLSAPESGFNLPLTMSFFIKSFGKVSYLYDRFNLQIREQNTTEIAVFH